MEAVQFGDSHLGDSLLKSARGDAGGRWRKEGMFDEARF
jgi:hypothetical protein